MSLTRKRIGLALSGGGFRASLYHLGLVRFLRDAGILPQITHITSVSGGSILAAHLLLNWDRYNGSANEFDAAASEFLSFVRLDVRNRITRRFPLAIPLRWLRRLVGRSNRKLTRTGLLEYHYEKFLYGDVSLFELPATPQLHLLATNLSEGCLCSFNRAGILMVRRQPGTRFRVDHIHVGLATVAMAVTASSAFPGFFPPLELTGADVGVSVGSFGRQAFTDGGVFDNLGVRMFRCLERSLLADNPLSRDDFLDYQSALEALRQAGQCGDETPLRRLGQVLIPARKRTELVPLANPTKSNTVLLALLEADDGDREDIVASNLGNVLRKYQFYQDPLFADLKPGDPDAESFFRACRSDGRILDVGDRAWLNRHLLEAAFRQATGRPCFSRLNSGLDGVLVSDVGKRIEVQANRRAGGVIRTALRSTDILMDRVWQLEKETFHDAPGFVFAPITEVVEPAQDPTALHPEIQRQTASIRTDMDRFSALEISSLVRHGYCVGRKVCRARPDLFGGDLPEKAPWDPVLPERGSAAAKPAITHRHGAGRDANPASAEARALQASAFRRFWTTLLDFRDWTSYVHVPVVIPILLLVLYGAFRLYQNTSRTNQLLKTFAQGSYELDLLTRLLANGPDKPWTGVAAEEVHYPSAPDLTGFDVLEDSRVIDLRNWTPADSSSDSKSIAYVYRRLKVLKQPEAASTTFHFPLLTVSPNAQMRFPTQELEAKLYVSDENSLVANQRKSWWEASFDFHTVAPGDHADVFVQYHTPGQFLGRGTNGTTLTDEISVATEDLYMWILMPQGREYKGFHITRHPKGKPEKSETVKLVKEYLAEDFRILAFKLQSLKPGYIYETAWFYK
jgi:predicted acylesterase/phospholipase RssA